MTQLSAKAKVKVASAPGLGPIALGLPYDDGVPFADAGVADGQQIVYVAFDDNSAFEQGQGTYSSTGPTLTRDIVANSSADGAKLNLSANAYVYAISIVDTGLNPQRGIMKGSLVFDPTLAGLRITADMSNAAPSSRFGFQTSIQNGATIVEAFPNGSSTTAAFSAENSVSATNGNAAQLSIIGNEARISNTVRGTGVAGPLTFWTGGAQRVAIDGAGNIAVAGNVAFAGPVTGPTEVAGSSNTRFATTAFVAAATAASIAALVGTAPAILDTLGEIATQLQSDENVATALATTVAGKVSRAGDTVSGNLDVHSLSSPGSLSTYGALTIKGSKGGYSGINFQDASGNDVGSLIVAQNMANRTVGYYREATSTWDWGFLNGSLFMGTVPYLRITNPELLTLGSGQITTALGYTPASLSGAAFTGNISATGVGIGTSTPLNTLHVVGGIMSTNGGTPSAAAGPSINMYYSTAADAGFIASIYPGTTYKPLVIDALSFGVYTGVGTASLGLYLSPVGNLGINTTVAVDKLTINGVGSYGQLRMIYGNYGVIFRNDGGYLYLMATNSGDQYGSWNAYRPFVADLTSGRVGIGGAPNTVDALQINGSLYTITGIGVGGLLTVQGSLNVNSNQVWNTAGDLYLQYTGNAQICAGGGTAYFNGAAQFAGSITSNANVALAQTLNAGAVGTEAHPWQVYRSGGAVYQYVQQNIVGVYDTAWGGLWNYNQSANLFTIQGRVQSSTGSAHIYGALTVRGAANGYSGINFEDASGNDRGTFMVNVDPLNRYTGYWTPQNGAWDWGFYNGAMFAGTVPASLVTPGTFGAGAFTVNGDLHVAGNLYPPGVVIQGTNGRNYFKDSESVLGGAGLRVGQAWGMYGLYADGSNLVLGSSSGFTQFQGAAWYVGNYGFGSGTTAQAAFHAYGSGATAEFRAQSAGGMVRMYDDNNSHIEASVALWINQLSAASLYINAGSNGQGNVCIRTTNQFGNLTVGGNIAATATGAQFLAPGYMLYSDGANFYILLSGNNSTPTNSFNGLRPFYIELNGTGHVHMDNGVTINGGATIVNNLTVDGIAFSTSSGGGLGSTWFSFGLLNVSGTRNTWGGFTFTDASGNYYRSLLANGGGIGFYNEAGGYWECQWGGGVLTAGTVPAARVSNGVKAWVSFDAAGNIQKSYNVSSLAHNSAGNYTVFFTTAMSDASFCAVGSGTSSGGAIFGVVGKTTAACNFVITNYIGTAVDMPGNLVIFD